VIPFQVQVPHDVVPGDHIGVFVVQSVPQRDGVNQLIERVATRLYVTVPGVASRGMVISGLSRQLHSAIWPSSVSLLTILRNTGRIALNPIVAVNGRRAAGSTTLLAESRELYSTKLHLPWWGGHVRLRILAWAPGVPLQTRELTFWVINWVLIAVVLLGLLTVALVVTMWRRRRRRARAERRTLESRLRELESLVQTGG
jgi:hypothetical protein